MKRTMFSILIVAIAIAVPGLAVDAGAQTSAAANFGPPLGKWEVTGKDSKGVARTGTLTVQKLDTERFDAKQYHSIFSFELESKDSSFGAEGPCIWEPGSRKVTIEAGNSVYTAVLSPDAKSLTEGKWTQSEKDFKTQKVTTKSTGVWSAKFTAP